MNRIKKNFDILLIKCKICLLGEDYIEYFSDEIAEPVSVKEKLILATLIIIPIVSVIFSTKITYQAISNMGLTFKDILIMLKGAIL